MLGLWAGGSAPQKITTHIAFAAALDDVLAAPRTLQAASITSLDFDGHPTDDPVVLAWMPAASIDFRGSRLVGSGNNIFVDNTIAAAITIGVPNANGVAILSPRGDEQN